MARFSFAVALSLFSACVVAAPTKLVSRDISADLLAKFELIEQYAAAAYCGINNNSSGTKVTCESGNCPLVQSATTTTTAEFEESIQNWIANFDFDTTATTICSGCPGHSGFWNSWQEARSIVTPAVKSAKSANPGYSIVVTGHSLGGAVADFAAAELRNDGYDVALYTYGAPRVAPAALSDYISSQSGGNYRVTHYNDPVPRLPTLNMGYVHISPEYYISTENNVVPTAADIDVYQGNSNLSGNARWGLNVDVNAHQWYFNDISACE